jgi:hypothetical protein
MKNQVLCTPYEGEDFFFETSFVNYIHLFTCLLYDLVTNLNDVYIVTCISIARQRFGKQARNKYATNNREDIHSLLDNGSFLCCGPT